AWLGLAAGIAERTHPHTLVPAVGQGALAIQTRRGDPLAAALRALADPDTETRIAAGGARPARVRAQPHTRAAGDRACEARLGADCNAALGAHALLAGGRVTLCVRLLDTDGSASIERTVV